MNSREGLADLQNRFNQTRERLNQKVNQHCGELIAASSREYESYGCGGRQLRLRERFEVGTITDRTEFTDCFTTNAFLSGVKTSKRETSDFYGASYDVMSLVADMDKPPEPPARSFHDLDGNPFRPIRIYEFEEFFERTESPRLALWIGDAETIPYLQNRLEGHVYMTLARTLERELPMTEKILRKIENEQFDLYKSIKNEENRLGKLTAEINRRLGELKEARRNGEDIIEDEVCINLNFGPTVSESRNGLIALVRRARERRYAKEGLRVERKKDSGVVEVIDFGEFFEDRIKRYLSKKQTA
ncbi:MAG: hypothetical protein AABW89_02325 [Nanoarchaeota archaeon]